MRGRAGGRSTPEFERLEQLPAVGGAREPAKPPATAASPAGDEHLEELPPAPNAEAPRRADRHAASAGRRQGAQLNVHSMRELLDLASDDRPSVAVEGGVYRIQPHAYFGTPGRDPGLRRLAIAVIGGTAEDGHAAHDDVAVRGRHGEALYVTAHGIELDELIAGDGGDEPAETRGSPLDRLGRRVDAVGVALLVCGPSGGYQSRQGTGLLRREAVRLAFADDDPVAARYLTRRVALVAEDPLHTIPGLKGRFSPTTGYRIDCLAFLPARADGGHAYLMLAAAHGAGAWDVHLLVRRLGLVTVAGTGGGGGNVEPAAGLT